MSFLSEETRQLIGARSPDVTSDPVSADAVRRFTHATLEEDSVFWDEAEAVRRYGAAVAPPLYPMHAFRRGAGTPDLLDRAGQDRDWDGLIIESAAALPPLDIPLRRQLNGGSSVEIHALARVGERITRSSEYESIEERAGRSGPLVIVRTRSDYRDSSGQLLISVQQSSIRR